MRNEANLRLSSFVSELLEFVEGFVEGAFLGDLIAEVESEVAGGFHVVMMLGRNARLLEADGASTEPFALIHAANEDIFGFRLRIVLFVHFCFEEFVSVAVFFRHDEEGGVIARGEAMFDGVLGGGFKA